MNKGLVNFWPKVNSIWVYNSGYACFGCNNHSKVYINDIIPDDQFPIKFTCIVCGQEDGITTLEGWQNRMEFTGEYRDSDIPTEPEQKLCNCDLSIIMCIGCQCGGS